MRKVSIITGHKPLIAIFKKDKTTLLQRLHCIPLRIHQYRIRILYKTGTDLFKEEWLSLQNHKENKDNGISGMRINIDAIHAVVDIPECMSIQDIQ